MPLEIFEKLLFIKLLYHMARTKINLCSTCAELFDDKIYFIIRIDKLMAHSIFRQHFLLVEMIGC